MEHLVFKVGDKIRLKHRPERVFTVSENYRPYSPFVECVGEGGGFSPFADDVELVPANSASEESK